MSGRSPSLDANHKLLDYTDTPKLRELYLAWCGENGFEPIRHLSGGMRRRTTLAAAAMVHAAVLFGGYSHFGVAH